MAPAVHTRLSSLTHTHACVNLLVTVLIDNVYICAELETTRDQPELCHTHGRCCMNIGSNWQTFFQFIAQWPAQMRSPIPDPWHVMCESCHVYSKLWNPAAFVFAEKLLTLKTVAGHTGMTLLQLSSCVPFMRLNHVSVLSIMFIIICLLYSSCIINWPW